MKGGAYLRLMRFHKPVGIVLLWCPTAWALWIANAGHPASKLVLVFLLGTVAMRAAGCVMNDIADRHIDKHVKRTQARPLTTGEVGLVHALILLLFLLLLAFCLLIQLPTSCFYYALFAVIITVVYPFCKRFFDAPQTVLGIAFSMGIPMAYDASTADFSSSMWLLFAISWLWIVMYDTMYAMADKADDLRIGVKSTAILIAHHHRFVLGLLPVIVHSFWLVLATKEHYTSGFYVGWVAGLGVLLYQQYLIRGENDALYLKAFASNVWYGLIMWLALLV